LAKAFGVTEKYVWMCLQYRDKNSDTARKIRSLAVQRGGVAMVQAPEMETLHDADGYMRQYFPNGAMIEVLKENGFYEVLHKGECVKRGAGLTIAQLGGLQQWAGGLR